MLKGARPMSLPYEILNFIARVKSRPEDLSNPALLDRLGRMAKAGFDGAFVALFSPIADLTWETRVQLPGGTAQSSRQPLIFPRPVEIAGFFPIVVPTTNGLGLLNPTTFDVDVSMDVNSQEYVTAGQGVSTPAGGTAGAFVTLANMSVQVPRLLGLKLTAPKPDLGMTFRWKRGAAPQIYNDALISVGVFARYC